MPMLMASAKAWPDDSGSTMSGDFGRSCDHCDDPPKPIDPRIYSRPARRQFMSIAPLPDVVHGTMHSARRYPTRWSRGPRYWDVEAGPTRPLSDLIGYAVRVAGLPGSA